MDPKADEPEGSPRPRDHRRKRPAESEPEPAIAFGTHKFKIESKETRIEIAARLGIEKAKLDHDLRKDFALFVGVMAIVAVATVACIHIVVSNRYPAPIQNSAMALLAVIVSGGVGYATGKSAK